ncbi:hypothetical protein EYC84_000056 [Monilinia fructicola]|uniref:Xanthine/uracil permease n=1 Tax=Monilinia fructicola TaxID=38448 RepID=A0A5M9JMD5_MONFR|nr:hypothetical protein EYC84_000056 [Monilinia fructicola]
MAGWTTKVNDAVADSIVGRRFRLQGSGHVKSREGARFFTEIRAGLATFFAMAYIISVNATILSDSGGTCVCTDTTDPTCATDVDYNLCLGIIRRDFITGTAAISALTSFCMGLFANMPIALAPGMGLNAYFTYTVVGFHGLGPVTYRLALTAVFVEGFRSLVLGTVQDLELLREPLQTPLELGGCLSSEFVDGVCPGSTKMRSPTMWIGIFCGGFVTAILMAYRVKGAIIAVTYFPHNAAGDANFDFFKKVVTFHGIQETLVAQDWNVAGVTGQFGLAFITFLYVDILDCTGTLYSMARFSGAIDEETQDFEGSAVAYLVDAFGISIGSLFGLSPVTAFIESGAGISEGGKTGITAMVTGICFFISILFAPIFASIPPWATGSTLIIVGAMMCKAAKDINWKYWGDALPAFITLAVMPFTYSIAYGLIAEPWTYKIKGGIIPAWVVRAAKGQKDFWHDEPPINTSSPGSLSTPDDADKSRLGHEPVTRSIDETKAGEKLA